uniref:ARAD1A14080p n=1 Tax=Blastobotrys adeninivorans TaxID=409370 RepID=A0A060SY68_BLAAD
MVASEQKVMRVGVVGAGRIGVVHITNMLSTRFVEVTAVCTVVAHEQKWVRETVPGATVYSDFDSFIKDSSIDVVWICSPTQFHQEHVTKALEAGKHAFTEKPLSGDEKTAWDMYHLSLKYPHLKVACGFVRRFANVYIEARKAIASGAIGDVIAVRASTADCFIPPTEQFLNYIKHSGGIFVDCNIHDIDLSLFLIGEDKTAQTAYATGTSLVYPKFAEWGDGDNVHGIVKFKEDLVFNIYGTRDNLHGHHTYTEIIGTKGRIMVNGEPRGLNVDISTDNGTKMVPTQDHQTMFADAFKTEVEHFRDWVLFDRQDHGFNLKDAAKAVSIGVALQNSFRSGDVEHIQ